MQPLKIAFLGYSAHHTARYLEQLAVDNAEQVRRYERHRCRVTLKDGTEIVGIMPGFFEHSPDGHRFAQVILADDRRMEIMDHRRRDMQHLSLCLQLSDVPEEYQLQIYDLDAEVPQYGV